VAQSGLQAALGFCGGGAIGLVAGDLAGRVLSALRLGWSGRLTGVFGHFPWRGIRQAARTYARFPKYMAGASILNLTAIQIPFLLVPVYFGAAAAGHYFLAYRTLFMPASFIGAAIQPVFLGEAAERARGGHSLDQLTSRLFLLLAAAYLPVYTVCLAGAGLLFPLVFGARWGEAGGLAQVLAPMTLMWSLARPICGMLLVRDRLKENLAFTVFELAAVAAAIVLGQRSGSIHLTVVCISGAGLLVSTTSVIRFLHAAEVDLVPVAARFGILAALNLPLGLLVWAAARVAGAAGTLLAAVAGMAAVALGSCRYLRRERLL
jgi:O-antigen/teichoic acid export membrane protein